MREPDLFWWTGATHADGYIPKADGRIKEIRLRVSEPSLQMLIKWRSILDAITEKRHRIAVENMYDRRYARSYEQYVVRESSRYGLARIVEVLAERELNPLAFEVPALCSYNDELGAAYLAGVIDGDGCIQLRKSSDGYRLEKLLKIASDKRAPLEAIRTLLRSLGLPDGYITDYANHSDLWVYLNKHAQAWSRQFMLAHLAIGRKRDKLTY